MAESIYTFQRHDHIGALAAEEDGEFLAECFVDSGFLDPLLDVKSPKRILVGRTGSGKSALVRHILDNNDGAILIEPERMALENLYQNTILGRLDALNVRLDVFFKLLWKHTIVLELLRTKFESTGYFLPKLRQFFRGRKQSDAVSYLEKWAGKFWNETDYSMSTITEAFVDRLEQSDSLKAAMLGADLSIGGAQTAEQKRQTVTEVNRLVQDIVSKTQMRELGRVLQCLNDVFDDPQKPMYVCVDGLDENWASPELRYRLVKSLIQVSKDFTKCHNVKPIIVVRRDLMQRVFRDTGNEGDQNEKYAALALELYWTEEELEDLLNRRVQLLVQRKYQKKTPVEITQLLPSMRIGRSKSNVSGTSFVLSKTLMRPRDAIALMNTTIDLAVGRDRITRENLRKAEGPYSDGRLTALCDEWSSEYPFLRDLIMWLLTDDVRQGKDIKVGHLLASERLLNPAILVIEAIDAPPKSLAARAKKYADDLGSEKDQLAFARELVFHLYVVGVLGVKVGPKSSFNWSNERHASLSLAQITEASALRVHPMLHRALGIEPQY